MQHLGNANVSIVQDTFARKEKKYVLSRGQYERFMASLEGMLEEEPFGRSLVSSLYYDTPHFELINRSMEKPLYKEKLRVRSYGAYDPEKAVFVELKTKFKGIVYKRRVQTSWQAAQAIMAGEAYADAVARYPLSDQAKTIKQSAVKEAQIGAELEAAVARHAGLRPSMMVVVDRLPLHSTDGSNVRITFDFDARYRTKHLDFSHEDEGYAIMADDRIIMEVKAQGAYPLWLIRALEAVAAYPQGCSKYGRAYAVAHPDVEEELLTVPVAAPSFAPQPAAAVALAPQPAAVALAPQPAAVAAAPVASKRRAGSRMRGSHVAAISAGFFSRLLGHAAIGRTA